MIPPVRAAAIAAIFIVLPLASAQSADLEAAVKKAIQEIDAKRAELHVPGVGLAIVKDDQVLFAGGLGHKDLERKRPVTGDTQFAIGSSTKAFVAMLLAMGADEGKVSFGDHPRKYVPYFRLSDPEADKAITVGGLLYHGSGLPRTDLVWAPGVLSTDEIIWTVGRAKPTAPYGKRFQYQNVMYAVAGEVLRGAYGKPWTELLDERLFSPLRMSESNTSVPEMLKSRDYALGYEWIEHQGRFRRLPMRDLPAIGAAGAINSSPKEMANWVRLMINGGQFGGKRLVSEANFAELLKPRIAMGGTNQYGYGWFLQKWDAHNMVSHGGNIDGFSALVSFLPEKKVGVVMLTNLNVAPLGPAVTEAVYGNLVGKSPENVPTAKLESPEREIGTYRLEAAKLDFAVTHEQGKLFVKPTGQPKMELIPLGNRKFKVAPPAPDKVFITFRPSKEDPKLTEAEFEQAGMKVALTRPKPYQAPISAEELMAKVVEAMGGEAAMRRVRTLSFRYVVDLENQGVKVYGLSQKQAPDLSADLSVFMAGGRQIGSSHTFYNGEEAVDDTNFSEVDVKGGADAGDLILSGLMFQELDWLRRFKAVTITGVEKVGDDEAYVLVKEPHVGNKITDHVSTKSFRVLKRSTGAGFTASTETYGDYRTVEGLLIPFRIVRESPIYGKGVTTVEGLTVNGPVNASLFKLAKRLARKAS